MDWLGTIIAAKGWCGFFNKRAANCSATPRARSNSCPPNRQKRSARKFLALPCPRKRPLVRRGTRPVFVSEFAVPGPSPVFPDVLVVDLDQALLHGGLRQELLWRKIKLTCDQHFSARPIGSDTGCDPQWISTLPFDTNIIAQVVQWKEAGGRALLATSGHPALAQAVATSLGIFDDVTTLERSQHEPDLIALAQKMGVGNLTYLGKSGHVTPKVPEPTLSKADSHGTRPNAVKHNLARAIAPYFEVMRPHHWVKNLLVFLPLLASHHVDVTTGTQAVLAFVAFCLVASGVYVVNDLLDLGADRAHPRKRLRPFASGQLALSRGPWIGGGLLVAGGAVSLAIGIEFLGLLLGYIALTTLYSVFLKRRIVIDICVLAGLYTARIIAGGLATGIALSVWLLAFSVFFFLSLAAIKRQAELIDSAERGLLRASGRGYHVDDLPIISMIAIGAGYVAVLVLTLYVNSPAVIVLYTSPQALWGACAVLLYWISRTIMMAHRGQMHDDPIVYAVKDRVSQICFVLILGFVVGGAVG